MANKPTQPNFPLGLEADEQSKLAGILNTGTIEHGPDAVMTVPEGEDAPGLPSSVRYNPASDQFEGYYLSGGWLPLGGGGIRWEVLPYSPQSNLLEGRGYLVDNTDGISTVVLPSPDRVGDSVSICDAFGKFSTYPLTVSGGTYPVYGAVEDMTVSTDNMAATFTWTGTERGWVITSGVGLGQGRVYSRTIYTQILSADTTQITLSTAPAIVDVYVDGKRLLETKYSLDGNNVDFTPALPSGSEVQIIEYTPIQLGSGGGGSGGGTVITWVYNGGSAVGGETEITLDVIVDSVSEIYIRGVRQQIGLGFTFDALTSKITLAEELEAGDEVVVVINGDPTIYNQIDRTLNEVARSNNIKNSEVIMSSDTSTVLDGKKVLYDSSVQKSYKLPTLPTGVRISSVSNGQMVYNPGGVTVQLLRLNSEIVNDFEAVVEENSVILNVAKAIQERREALGSNKFRICTWNVQAFASLPSSPTFDNARFNARLDNQLFVREHIEWLLSMGADVVGIQEFYGTFATKKVRSPGYTTIGSNWCMYPYIDSFMTIETVGKADGRTGYQGGNLTLATRKLNNGAAHQFTASPSAEGTYRSWSRVEIDVNGTTVAVYNTHLTTDTTVQNAQMAELVAAVSTDTAGHIVLVGDWNNPNDTIFQSLVNIGFTVSPQINSNNYPGGTWYYDRVIHRGFSAVTPPSTMTPPYELGDHKPVYLDLTL